MSTQPLSYPPILQKMPKYFLQHLTGVNEPLPHYINFEKKQITDKTFFSRKILGEGEGVTITNGYTCE